MSSKQRSTGLSLALVLLLGLAAVSGPLLAASPGVVNINTAGTEELALLPRIGSTVAERIVEFREENGSFKHPEELMLVRGIGERVYEQIRPYVTLDGETTLKEKVRTERAGAGEPSAGGSTQD